MAVTTHLPTKLLKAQGQLTSGQAVNFSSDTFKMLAVKAGSGLPLMSSTGVQFVSDVTGTNAEDTAIGSRITLSGVTWSFDATLGVVDFSFSNVTYAQNGADDGATRYFVIQDTTVGATDATSPVIAIIDPGQFISVVNNSQVLQCPTGGLLQFTGGG